MGIELKSLFIFKKRTTWLVGIVLLSTVGFVGNLIHHQPVSLGSPQRPETNLAIEGDSLKLSPILIPIEKMLDGPYQISQDEPELIELIRREYLVQPSTKPYHLTRNEKDPSEGQTTYIKELLNNKANGFFIEVGAYDGEKLSNTLMFERELNWTGLLIEGNPKNFDKLFKKNRKSWLSPVCLTTEEHPVKILFYTHEAGGYITADQDGYSPEHSPVQCLPLYSLMLALNITWVDYLSLDVEGSELEVLQTIPWDRVQIATISVEFFVGNRKEEIVRFLESKGYIQYKLSPEPGHEASFLERKPTRIFVFDVIMYHPVYVKYAHKNPVVIV